MNLHEYQGKEILSSFGVEIQRGIVAQTPQEAVEAAKKLTEQTGTGWHVIKAQVHAGGRGKGGGVKLAKNLQEVESISNDIIGMNLVTPQTSKEGKKVHQVLVAEDVYYPGDSEPEEYYMGVLLNRATGKNMVMYSTEGGMDIETVAEETPHLIFTEEIDPATGLQGFQARKIAFNLGLKGQAFKQMTKFVTALYKAYMESDSSMFEINPVLKTSDDKIIAVDAKVTLDENALFRHKDYAAMRDIREENPTEVEAKEVGLNYVDLDGNVGCMVNGAGLAMATMDLIKQAGGSPANFLDVGGTADAARVEAAFRLILKDPEVKAILINIFGGIVRCDRVAQGVVDAYKAMGDAVKVPIIVRLQGTNADIAKELIDNSGLPVQSAIEFKEAADKVQAVLA
ncbi:MULTISPECIES: ADP-forming succinate--CoA ligase subunit beta [Croceibacter]|jgi:succinyl-CoA synthetase beta subunit|uniref:Succinate--CoA ligase [ADP-forming] subunit beta n=1 Tax=Croceibacter atlanticus (strain ATCC BAA-628 / JCM 21780 / CIP 108009 / IAM 15332 / KCTC 12090 / HTCC2559) TaxID=216432 RepID=A3UBR5_CROAH|nr:MULTISPECIES: ADP-forming succinate--CoA ligase subunit beta [Croceibacter]HAT69594.1 ADP-forming succinate--CoA ligase subunit beta [Flavobacteriaceae bacterium]EAP86066.1 Succinyl-CoA synthetase, beta subunit [Croceibacter atlanticus HTCC2559]MAM22730.1 ADP-forming succinate--CoA ligase subunit beta [Croceibacter sp.]MBG24663.1 ADP-forming succinate--CoA ligase subunit beta [Croceibacter sp.]MBG26367.1 ADP-forming succinate--CoA ligase subunit beta [Croceibacter sp.]|tara:strand:- start:3550 stop:4743 length:1194 start_codon:yes stop_codon:yes gene_type:complete